MVRRARYRFTSRFDRSPAEVWPVIADTNRLNETAGTWAPYTAQDVLAADGSVRRHARGRLGPLRVQWEEGFGEWVENRYMRQVRHFTTGPFSSLGLVTRLEEDAGGVQVEYVFEATWETIFGTLLERAGVLRKGTKGIVRGFAARIAALEASPGESETAPVELTGTASERLHAILDELDRGPFAHGLAPRLGEFLTTAPAVDLKRIRPLALARQWGAPAEAVIELLVAAQQAGLLAMGWAILCPRCRGAKSRIESLYELPRGVHCESCNIDYERDFSRNVELVFTVAPWLRELPEGEFCMMGPASTPHVKLQREVEPNGVVSERLALPAGRYRLRTVEAGGQCDVESDGVAFPEVIARGGAVEAGAPAEAGHVTLRNLSDRRLSVVVEERAWTADALTGPQVIAMQAFRELCPEQLLRPGDDVAIGQVTIMFTDLKGSTALYADIGDSTAYGVVRDHFAFLADRVRRHRGALIKTMGDAVMAAFDDPTDGVRAALTIQRDVAAFNATHDAAAIVVKLGLHRGSCIAVSTGGVLDYFGTTVNVAARLQGESRGGDIVFSADVVGDPAVARLLPVAQLQTESAVLHGFTEAMTFYRLASAAAP